MQQITIMTVANMCGLEPVRHRSNYYRCPFCGSKSFNIYEKYDSFSCFGCSEKGGIAALYGKLKNMPYESKEEKKEIMAKIMKELGTGHISEGFSYSSDDNNKEIPQSDLAKPEVINATYHALLSSLSLSDKHREDLHKRGFSDADIDFYKFRSTPVNMIAAGKTDAIVTRLISKGFQVKGVPGFYRNRDRQWDINLYEKINGILCPVFDLNNFICGFQIRLDNPYDGRKYIWLTSKGKYMGVSSGSPCTFVGNFQPGVPVVVTEGVLKATVYNALTGQPVIGQPGITQTDDCCRMLRDLGATHVIEAFDMDRFLDLKCKKDYGDYCLSAVDDNNCPYCLENVCIKKARKMAHLTAQTEKLYQKLNQLDIQVTSMRWDMEDGIWSGKYKGCDDAALAGIEMYFI